jgi:septum formation protein
MDKIPPILLASASPRRKILLEQIGVTIADIIPADIDETALKGELPRQLAGRLAAEKARHIASSHSGQLILAADTVVAAGRKIYGKPENADEARMFLTALSGRRHDVYGGITVITPQGQEINRIVHSVVKIKSLSDQEIAAYLATGDWEGKAGAYAIQGSFSAQVKGIIGSYTNIVGLCTYSTMQILNGISART